MATLKQITTRARSLYKKGKAGISWRDAIKKASKQTTRKAAPKKKAVKKRAISGTRTKKAVKKITVIRRAGVVKVAGIGAVSTKRLHSVMGDISTAERGIERCRQNMQGKKGKERTVIMREMSGWKSMLQNLKKQKTLIKRSL